MSMTFEEFKVYVASNKELSSIKNRRCASRKKELRNEHSLGYANSIGGTALRVGSVKVSTINLARIALKCDNEADYIKELRRVTRLNLKILDVQRSIIKKNIERGLLNNYKEGLIDIKTQYSTIGVIGVYETMKTFGYVHKDEFGNTFYNDEAFTFGKRIFEVIHQLKDDFAKDKDYMINLEAVPAESAAGKMQYADSLLYPETVVDDLPLYGNQFCPLGIKATLQERVRIASAFDEYCSGGSILHVNIDAPFNSFDQAYDMTKYILSHGVTYFAFNPVIDACEDNHAFYGKICPVCGKPAVKKFTRIVGFFTEVGSWSKDRKAEFKLREWHDLNAGLE